MVLPKSVGSTAITYLPDRRASTASFGSCLCSIFPIWRDRWSKSSAKAINWSTIWQEVINSPKKIIDSVALSTDQSEFPVAGATGNSERVGYCNGSGSFLHFSSHASLGHFICLRDKTRLPRAKKSGPLDWFMKGLLTDCGARRILLRC